MIFGAEENVFLKLTVTVLDLTLFAKFYNIEEESFESIY